MHKGLGPLIALGLGVLGVWFLLRLTSNGPAASAPIQYRPRRLPEPQHEVPPGLLAAPAGSTYSNLEEWEIVRNEKGRIQSIRIHRNAQVT